MGLRPTIKEGNTDYEYIVMDGNRFCGAILWVDEWKCHTFTPTHGTHFGPIFLSDLISKMLELDKKFLETKKGQGDSE